MDRQLTRISKFLSLVLRHKPGVIGLELDEQGWLDIDVLIDACRRHGRPLTREQLDQIVEQNEKRRFVVRDGRIRAAQGHTIAVDLGLRSLEPPAILFHGTTDRFLPDIRLSGLRRMTRRYVHLSPDEETARSVGVRRGRPVILRIEAGRMHRAGFRFFLSENGVWLTESVPPDFIAESGNRPTDRCGSRGVC